jgi:hypothetical protein
MIVFIRPVLHTKMNEFPFFDHAYQCEEAINGILDGMACTQTGRNGATCVFVKLDLKNFIGV